MPDITMCEGTDGQRSCPQRDKCYRHTATPSDRRQSWFIGTPMTEDGACRYFWDNWRAKGSEQP
jgi:hypothetical protein